jgi:uncharacterized protein (DUF2062 family)
MALVQAMLPALVTGWLASADREVRRMGEFLSQVASWLWHHVFEPLAVLAALCIAVAVVVAFSVLRGVQWLAERRRSRSIAGDDRDS